MCMCLWSCHECEPLKTNNTVCKFNCSTDEWEIDRTSLIISDKKLGKGAFADVYKATIVGRAPVFSIYKNLTFDLFDTDQVAVKMLQPHAGVDDKSNFLAEIDFMKRLGYHAHIVSLVGCCTSGDHDWPMLIIEYCAHGDMLQFVRKRKRQLMQMVCNI